MSDEVKKILTEICTMKINQTEKTKDEQFSSISMVKYSIVERCLSNLFFSYGNTKNFDLSYFCQQLKYENTEPESNDNSSVSLDFVTKLYEKVKAEIDSSTPLGYYNK